jgi:hypothetical protein
MARGHALIEALDRSKKRILVAFGLAILMHLPVTPVLPVLRIVHRLALRNKLAAAPLARPAPPPEVEVQLESALRQEQQYQQRKVEAEAAREPDVASRTSLSMAPPANVPFNASEPTPPRADDPVETNKDQEAEKLAETKPKPKEKLKDIGLEGNLSKKEEAKPGITLGLWLSSLREQELGKELARIATCDREWRVFSEQGVDLLKDFDGVLIVGPSLNQPQEMTAAVRHSLPAERVHAVIDGLVQKSGKTGRWLKPNVATARLGKMQRMLLPHQDDLFFLAPMKGWEALDSLAQPMSVPKSEGRLASLVVSQPNRVLDRLGIELPARISSLRLEVFVDPDESGNLRLELEEPTESAALADVKKVSRQLSEFFSDAWMLTSTLSKVTGASATSNGPELAPRLELTADGTTLTGDLRLSPGQTRTTVNLVAQMLCRNKKAGAKRQ